MYYLLYQCIGWLVFTVAFPVYLIYISIKGKAIWEHAERFGFLKPIETGNKAGPRLWLHAASVGEVQAARALTREIRRHLPASTIIVTTVTEQGRAVASQLLAGEAVCLYAPLDLAGIVGRVFRTVRPSVYICLETELWPSILRCVHKNGIPALLLNGRLSERSRRRYGRCPFLPHDLLPRFSRIAAIRQQDAERFVALGAAPEQVLVCGNVKYSLSPAPGDTDVGAGYRARLGVSAQTPVLVAGSTHTGEETQLLEAFRLLRRRIPDLVLIIAPRHLRRLPEIETIFDRQGVAYDLFSRLPNGKRRNAVVLVDTMGELASLYAAATYVFCGGSLVPRGGHNIMEAAAWAKPVFYGPSMKDFRDAQELLEEAGAGFLIHNGRELAERIVFFADRPEEYAAAARKAGTVSRAQQGAAARQLAMIMAVLAEQGRTVPARRNPRQNHC